MASDLLVWSGPVADFQVPEAELRGVPRKHIACCGDLTPPCTPPTCPDIGVAVMSGDPAMLASRVGFREPIRDLYLAGFSAGGSIMKRVLTNPAYRAKVAAVYGADATYTAQWLSGNKPPPIEGYVAYGVDVVEGRGDKLLVLSASPSPNKTWATGVQNLQAIREEIEKRTGRSFQRRADFFGIEPSPDAVWQLGNVILAEYPMEPLGHGHTAIAGQVFRKVIQPWVDKGKGDVDSPDGISDDHLPPVDLPPVLTGDSSSMWVKALAFSGAAAGAFLVMRRIGR